MPRPLRLEYENAWYHVMNRGASRKNIFKTDQHRHFFLDALSEASTLFGAEIHAYCLMGNHYHLLIKTPRGNLSRIMRHVNGVYTQRYNRDTGCDGALFRGRYKAILVEGDEYLLQVSRYIHLNPSTARMSRAFQDYPWSSYRHYLKTAHKPGWLYTQPLLAALNSQESAHAYKKFVMAGLDEDTKNFYAKKNCPVIFGSRERVKALLTALSEKKIRSAGTDYNNIKILPTFDQVNQACATYSGVPLQKVVRISRRRGQENLPRMLGIYGCRMWASGRLKDIATLFGCRSFAAVSNAVKRVAERMDTDNAFRRTVGEVRKKVSDN